MRSFIRPFVLGVAALGLLAAMVSTAEAQRFRTFTRVPNRVTPSTTSQTFTPGSFTTTQTVTPNSFKFTRTATPSTFTATGSFTTTPNTFATFRPVTTFPNGSFLQAHRNLSPSQEYRLALAYSPASYALAAGVNPYGYNPYSLSRYGGYNPYLATAGYGGGFGSGYGGGGYGGYGGGGYGGGYGGYAGVGSQSPYLAASYQNPIQASAPAQPEAAPTDSGSTVNINVYDGAYQPSSITISAGTIVRWKNTSRHTQTVTSDSGIWDSGEVDPGRTVSVYFAKPGTYTYHCTLNPDKMRGTIIVE